jgi:pilus assembly protein CpaB
MNKKRRIIGVVAAALLATAGTVALVGYVQAAKDDALADEALVEVYVVDRLIPKGAAAETITASVSLEQVPARLEQDGAITDLDAVGDAVAASDLQPGDQLLEARLVPKDEVVDEVDDKVQVAALLTAERAVGGALRKGDLVGVYLSFDPFQIDEAGQVPADPADALAGTSGPAEVETDGTAQSAAPAAEAEPDDDSKTPNVTKLEFQHVLVTNVQTVDAPVTDDAAAPGEADGEQTSIAQVSGKQYIVTLALSPEQSERFVFATEFGHVWLANQPATVTDDGTRLVTLGNVFSVVAP